MAEPFSPLLLVMNPRKIPEAMESLGALPIRKAWLQGYTEWELVSVIDSIMRDPAIHFTHAILCADDVVVPVTALEAVLGIAQEHPVVTGYCRLDSTHRDVNITRGPLKGNTPVESAYDFWRYAEVRFSPVPVLHTGFVGFALTCMSREMWLRFPFGVFGGEAQSWSSDFHLSMRLRDAGVPMVAARDGYIEHLKEKWQRLDERPGTELLIGQIPAIVELEEAS